MKKIFFLGGLLIFSSLIFCGCKQESQPASLVANWVLNDTFPPYNTVVNLNLNIIDNSHYIFSGTAKDTALAIADTGTYTIGGNLVTFTSSNATSPCNGHPGQYNYGVYGNYLTLVFYQDNCNFGLSPRADYLTSTNWMKQ